MLSEINYEIKLETMTEENGVVFPCPASLVLYFAVRTNFWHSSLAKTSINSLVYNLRIFSVSEGCYLFGCVPLFTEPILEGENTFMLHI